MNKQDQLTQVLAQLDILSSVVRDLQNTDPSATQEPKTVKLQCVGVTAGGSQCKRSAVTGTTRCHLHPQDAPAPRKARKSRKQKTVADDTLTVKANRAGANVAIQALDDALQAGTTLVYVRSNVGAGKVNKALRKRGYTVTGFAKRDDGTRTWDVSGHGHTYTHVMGKYEQGQTTHHRQMVKVA